MEEILSIIADLLCWRVILCAVGSISLALILSAVIPSFTAGFCIALVILGIAIGVYWQVRAEDGKSAGSK